MLLLCAATNATSSCYVMVQPVFRNASTSSDAATFSNASHIRNATTSSDVATFRNASHVRGATTSSDVATFRTASQVRDAVSSAGVMSPSPEASASLLCVGVCLSLCLLLQSGVEAVDG